MTKTIVLSIALCMLAIFASNSANACPKGYHQCGSFCCGN